MPLSTRPRIEELRRIESLPVTVRRKTISSVTDFLSPTSTDRDLRLLNRLPKPAGFLGIALTFSRPSMSASLKVYVRMFCHASSPNTAITTSSRLAARKDVESASAAAC
jgi:hypothetical protein